MLPSPGDLFCFPGNQPVYTTIERILLLYDVRMLSGANTYVICSSETTFIVVGSLVCSKFGRSIFVILHPCIHVSIYFENLQMKRPGNFM